jgi:hypothetical protein
VCVSACGDDDFQKPVDNSSPLSPVPLPNFTLTVKFTPKAAEQLAKSKDRVRISILPVKIADRGETPDWWEFVTMGPSQEVWIAQSGDVTFKGMKVKSRFLGNGGYDKIIANVNAFTAVVNHVECESFDVSVQELAHTHHVIHCNMDYEPPGSRSNTPVHSEPRLQTHS